MKTALENGIFHLRPERPLDMAQAAELSESLAQVGAGDAICLDLSPHGSLDAVALAVVLATASECRERGVEFRVQFPAGAANLVADLRLARHMVLETSKEAK